MMNMDTSMFLPKTKMLKADNPSVPGTEILGIDLGYSSIKTAHKGGYVTIPGFCRRMKGDLFGQLADNDIVYEADGAKYQVGQLALNSLKPGENVDEASFYGREHYLRSEFLVQFRTAAALSLWDSPQDRPVKITTGLPPAYISEDSEYLKGALAGQHTFTIHRGPETRKFSLSVDRGDIETIIQPMGTFFSVGMNDKGDMTPMLRKYWSSNVLIFDGGFGTLDIYILRGNEVERSTTDDRLGMKRVFDEVRKALYKDHGVSVTVPELMSCLGTGKVRRVNKKTLQAEEIDFSGYLKTANRIVAQEALDSVKMDLGSIDNFVMTGGTGAAWFHIFEDKLKGLTSAGALTLIPGNVMNQSLPYYLSNVRGYYLKRYYQEAHRKA